MGKVDVAAHLGNSESQMRSRPPRILDLVAACHDLEDNLRVEGHGVNSSDQGEVLARMGGELSNYWPPA